MRRMAIWIRGSDLVQFSAYVLACNDLHDPSRAFASKPLAHCPDFSAIAAARAAIRLPPPRPRRPWISGTGGSMCWSIAEAPRALCPPLILKD